LEAVDLIDLRLFRAQSRSNQKVIFSNGGSEEALFLGSAAYLPKFKKPFCNQTKLVNIILQKFGDFSSELGKDVIIAEIINTYYNFGPQFFSCRKHPRKKCIAIKSNFREICKQLVDLPVNQQFNKYSFSDVVIQRWKTISSTSLWELRLDYLYLRPRLNELRPHCYQKHVY
jgi:hypothetical protein